MTDKTQALLPVTPEDRQAAAPFANCLSDMQDIFDGKADGLPVVQAFARHRISHSLPGDGMLKLEWRDGPPPKPWSEEWFIAETIYGDRVTLRSLPEEWSYDFTTADETYMKAENVKRWMQFPDSQYRAPAQATELPQ